MSRILGIDYGSKRIGIAISDESQTIAFDYGVISNKNLVEIKNELAGILKKYEVQHLILGLPVVLDGHSSSMTEEVYRFKKFLADNFPIKIDFIDERFTSITAKKLINAIPKKSRRQKALKDAVEATEILQIYLDRKKTLTNDIF